MSKEKLYRVVFSHIDSVYEIYAKNVAESDMFGFIVIEAFVFGENTTLVVDPSEERLKLEFNGVQRTYIPMQSIFRIDEVEKRGVAKVRDRVISDSKVTMLPIGNQNKDFT